MKLEFETRQADRGDTRFLTWVIQEAARSHLEVGMLDIAVPDSRRRLDFIEATTHTPTRSIFHYSRFRVAESDGRSIAALSGYGGPGPFDLFETAWEEAGRELSWTTGEIDQANARLESVMGPFPDSPEDCWVVEFVATLPEFRGHGVVTHLLEEILDKGREENYRRAQISCFIGNTGAHRAYERVGFELVEENRDADFEKIMACPGIVRMQMDL